MARRTSKTIVRNIDGVTHIIQKPSRRQRFKRWLRTSRLVPVIGLALVAVIVAGTIFTVHNHQSRQSSNEAIIAAVGTHMVLPANEKPILATVTDHAALKTPFLREASNGDKILFYEKAKRVIIYRPSIDRIINVGPIELSNIPKTTTQQ